MYHLPPPKVAYDPHISLDSVGRHKRSRREFCDDVGLVIQREVKIGPSAAKGLSPYLFKWTSDTRMLREVWDRLSKFGGSASGPNGRRYSSYQGEEIWEFLKAISATVRNGNFEPEPPRKVSVPKDPLDPARGNRILSILNIEERVIQAAILQVLRPLREPMLASCIYGGRRWRSRFEALAHAEIQAIQEKRWVWLTEDINNAYDCVPRQRLQQLLLKRIPCPHLVKLIVKLASSGPKRGIHQGGPLSPHLLNEYLDRFLVEPWRKKLPTTELYVYVDDLLAVCRTQKEARESWTVLRDLLQSAGLAIKGSKPADRMRDLRKGETVEWLGFLLAKNGDNLHVRINEKAWNKLATNLYLAHEQPNSPLVATATIQGWLDQVGPSFDFEDQDAVLDRIQHIAGELAFDEIPSHPALLKRWETANSRWKEIRKKASEPPADDPVPDAAFDPAPWPDDDEPPF